MSRAADTDLGESRVWINGDPMEVAVGLSLSALLERLGRNPRAVAVEYNGRILGRTEYSKTELQAGDRLEVVQFVQGGSAG